MTRHWWMLMLVIIWSIEVQGIYHLKSMQRFHDPEKSSESLFGYSIAYQSTTKRLIISAPNSDIGKIYECNIENKQCFKYNNDVPSDYLSIFGKKWLGATVATGTNFTMACAPRHMEKKNRTGTFGRCYATLPNSLNMTEMQHLKDEDKIPITTDSYYERYMDTLGWSIDATNNGSILVGGPGMFTGRAVEYSSVDAYPRLLNFSSNSGIAFNYGYSVTSGNFFSTNKDEIIYAISSPYGVLGMGTIIVYDGTKVITLKYPQSRHAPGAMLGAAMAAASLEPAKPQALLVSAPAYTDTKDQIDVGAVYIYTYNWINKNTKALQPLSSILGYKKGGRFGSAIVNLGDLNGDGGDEIAVAAPYEDEGVVYVYSAAHIANNKYLQKITAAVKSYRTFGLSLAVLRDHDNNGCNELAIGAPESSEVAVFSCMATIIVQVNKLQEKKKALRKMDTNFVFESCVDIKLPAKPTNIQAEIEVKISITHDSATLVKSRDDGSVVYTINVKDRSKSRFCNDVSVIIPMESRDRMIQYAIRVTQLNSPAEAEVFSASRVLLSDVSKLTVSDSVWVVDCEGGKECKPKFEEADINIITSIPNNYTIGSSSTERVSVRARNSGDTAYSACARVRVLGAPVQRHPTDCASLGGDALECQPKIPVKTGSSWQSDDIHLDMLFLNSDSKEITIIVDVYPTCSKEKTTKNLTITLQPDPTEILIKGSTNIEGPVEITTEELEETGKQMSHFYTVFNFGVTDWVNIKCEITLKKERFFTALELNVESVVAECSTTVETDEEFKTVCIIEELKKSQSFIITIPLTIKPKTIKKEDLFSEKLKISSHLNLIYGKSHQEQGVISPLKSKANPVPVWIIVVAALVGLVIIGLIIFALYECGYLRRKNKDELRKLRRSVYRQSVRRSQIRESMRSAQRRSSTTTDLLKDTSDTHLDEAIGDGYPEDISTEVTCVEIQPEKVQDDFHKKVKVNNFPEEADEAKQMRSSSIPNTEKPLKTLPEEDEECKIKKKEQIIRGLQKNLQVHRSNQFLDVSVDKEKRISQV